jgi:hypothetical protein
MASFQVITSEVCTDIPVGVAINQENRITMPRTINIEKTTVIACGNWRASAMPAKLARADAVAQGRVAVGDDWVLYWRS